MLRRFFFLQAFVCLNESKGKDLTTILTFRSANDAGSVGILCSSDSRTLIQVLLHLLRSDCLSSIPRLLLQLASSS